jgi:hypothetical protein
MVEKKGTCMRGLAIEPESMPGLGGACRRLAGQLEENARALLLHLARLATSIHSSSPLDLSIDRSIHILSSPLQSGDGYIASELAALAWP